MKCASGISGPDISASTQALAAVDACYSCIDGYAIARQERAAQRAAGIVVDGIQYGEVKPSSFAQVLAWLAPEPEDVFVDVGSGTGRAVLTSAALYPLGGAIGIEIQPNLHTAAMIAHTKLDWSAAATGAERVQFCLEDGLASGATWPASATLVFCTTTCFTDEMLATFTRLAARLRQGARVAITTRGFKGAPFELLQSGLLPYAKGALTFHIYRRI